MSKFFQKNKDYAEAIAREQNHAKRQQLLFERQNKIDALGLAGKVASNHAVSTWHDGYRPYEAPASPVGYGKRDAMDSDWAQMLHAIEVQRQNQLAKELASIESSAENARRAADAAHQRAIRQGAEFLAKQGLQQGAHHHAPTSGTAETARILQENDLQNALADIHARAQSAAENARTRTETTQAQTLARLLPVLQKERRAQEKQALDVQKLALAQQKAHWQAEHQRARLSGKLPDGGDTLALRTLLTKQTQNAQNQREKAHNRAISHALAKWKAGGVLSAQDAKVLGLPAHSATLAFRLAQMRKR